MRHVNRTKTKSPRVLVRTRAYLSRLLQLATSLSFGTRKSRRSKSSADDRGGFTQNHDTRRPDHIATDPALQCLFRLGIRRGIYVEIEVFKQQHDLSDHVDIARLVALAPNFGVTLALCDLGLSDLQAGGFREAVMLALNNGNTVLVTGVERSAQKRFAIVDPLASEHEAILVDQNQLESKWSGTTLLASPLPPVESRSVGFGWFMAKIFAEKRALRDIVIAAVAIHFLALAVPIFFQILIDRVVPNGAFATLYVLAGGVTIAVLFDAIFNFGRNYLLAHLQRKVDFIISCETVEHLLSLPMDYFNETPAGVVAYTVQEATNVREFLTGRLFNTILDLLGIFIFLPLLFLYSWQLLVLVIMFSLISFVVLGFLSRSYRREVQTLTVVEGQRKGLMVELTHGISTIKTLALESHCNDKWRRASYAAADCGLRIARTAANARALLGSLEKMLMVAIGAFGAVLVFDNHITVGALVAFNMISARVSTPLIQSGSLLQDFQKAAASLNILRLLMERAPEPQVGQLAHRIAGRIEFENVTFHYSGSDRPAIDALSFRVEAGQTIGIVGRSGSGKTTVSRLIQGLYRPQTGLIALDGLDVKEMNLADLRSQIGVVLQETFLFRGTVRENIAIKLPHAPLSEIMHAAQLAGAHDFIQRLRHGYATELEEGAVNLSGGQRQRLAIARVLLTDPRILIFDEATSSLDPESEAIILSNLQAISRGRTTIIVSHRLSFVRHTDQILVLDSGRLTSAAPHDALVENDPTYCMLWRQQAQLYTEV